MSESAGQSGPTPSALAWFRALLEDGDVMGAPGVMGAAAALMRYAPARGTFFASEGSLSKLGQQSPASTRRGTARLQEAGYLVKVRRGGGPNRRANTWKLSLPVEHPSASHSTDTPLPGERSSDRQLRSLGSGDGERTPLTGDENSAHLGVELRSSGGGTPLTGEHPVRECSAEESSSRAGPTLHRRHEDDDDQWHDDTEPSRDADEVARELLGPSYDSFGAIP